MPPRALILGLGNPILGDDGVGWKVAEAVQAVANDAAEVDFAALGGLSLMERMLGYSHVILIDCLETGEWPVGSVRSMRLEDLENPSAGHSASAHDTSLITALRTAQTMGGEIPERVDVVTIEAKLSYDFSESLSPEVAAAVPVATHEVLRLLDGGS
ncbi:MAG TPA: hydrogenase maturation protease [Anaerolineales bacterium]|nr:hydrogenase maturation protease [Anaerolineales bacterium]